jgi:hypothetical protein
MLAAPAYAQSAESQMIGLIASTGTKSVGSCAEFSCVPRNLDMDPIPGTVLSLNVYGAAGSPFFIAASIGAGSCIRLPGFAHNSFGLHPATTVILAAGTLKLDGVNVCGRARGSVGIAIPGKVRAGDSIGLQALAFSSVDEALPSFSRPITVTAAPQASPPDKVPGDV